MSRTLNMIAAAAMLAVAPGLAADMPSPRMPSRPRRKPGAPHAGTREIERRRRQDAARAARLAAQEGHGG